MNAMTFSRQPAAHPPDNGWCVCIWVSIEVVDLLDARH